MSAQVVHVEIRADGDETALVCEIESECDVSETQRQYRVHMTQRNGKERTCKLIHPIGGHLLVLLGWCFLEIAKGQR